LVGVNGTFSQTGYIMPVSFMGTGLTDSNTNNTHSTLINRFFMEIISSTD